MITITDKHNCCGCAACVQACPKHCISFEEDEKGFRYPLVDKEICVKCGLCETVCPVLHPGETRKPLNVYAAINPNEEVRKESSSGGIFTMLAESILDEGGVVFGARFNEQWEVVHDYTETKEGLAPFRGSKYVQSRVGETYQQTKSFLIQGRKVIYTGTPCQIAGLRRFLGKEYDNLLTVDVVCHGVPSPMVWRDYLRSVTSNKVNQITSVKFREKSTGWKNYSVKICRQEETPFVNEPYRENPFMQVFLKDFCLRPSCHTCPAKSGKSGSDLTIADFWGINDPDWDDDRGTSLILVHSRQGQQSLYSCNIPNKQTSYEDAISHNPSIEKSVAENRFIAVFWQQYHVNGLNNIQSLLDKTKPSIVKRLYGYLRRLI